MSFEFLLSIQNSKLIIHNFRLVVAAVQSIKQLPKVVKLQASARFFKRACDAIARGGTTMSKSNTRSFIIRLFVFVVALALVGTDLIVSAQNTNSGTTMQNDNMSAQNSNMSGTNMNRRGRQGSRRGNANTGMANANTTGDMQGNVNTGEATSNANMTGKTSMGGRRRRGRRRLAGNMAAAITASTTPVRTGRCDPNVQEQTDLSGTYMGTVNYAEGGLSGDVTLTITGNDFTVTGGSTTVS